MVFKTKDCISSLSGTCGSQKERILNHLEGQNLLPSLEDILNDYFAYQGPDEIASDKVYMLWKQLDVVIGQLRAITMGKTKAKAFMTSRRYPRSFSKDHRTECANETLADSVSSAKKETLNDESTCFPMVAQQSISPLTITTTPIKQQQQQQQPQQEERKEFRSPRRKARHPRHMTTSTDKIVHSSYSDVVSDIPLNKEFSDLVTALITNDKMASKLADNINKVVSVETSKPPSKVDDIDEIIKLAAGDPDLNMLFSMIAGSNTHQQHHHQQQEQEHQQQQQIQQQQMPPVDQNCNLSTSVAPASFTTTHSSPLESFLKVQQRRAITTTNTTLTEIVGSDHHQQQQLHKEPYLEEPNMSNFLDGILDQHMMGCSYQACVMNPDLSACGDKLDASAYVPLQLASSTSVKAPVRFLSVL